MVFLKAKWISGKLKPFTLVDNILIQQGFKRCGMPERPNYQLAIQDSATQCIYFLTIPTSSDAASNAGGLMSRLGHPFLRKKVALEKYNPNIQIPDSVKKAAESKLAEIADYLSAQKI